MAVEDIERRLMKLEDGLGRMEHAIERMASGIETLVEVRVLNDNNVREISKLREASHDHSNLLQELVYMREKVCRHESRQDNLEERLEVLESHDPMHTHTDTIINKAMWAAVGVIIAVVLHEVGLL